MRLPLQTPRAAGLALRALRAGLTALATLVLVTCTDNPIGPGRLTPAALQVRPVFDANARFAPLVLTSARLIVVRPASDTIARVTGTFNATTNQVQLTATVLLHGLTEDLDVTLELYAGSVLIFSGTQRLTVSGSGGGQPQSVPVTYQGPGSGATSVSIAPQDTTVLTGSLTPMRATADSQSVPVTQFYASWTLLGAPAGAAIDAAGLLTAPATRDTFQVVVSTPSGLADTTFVYVAAAPATLVKVSGDGQSATVGTRLPQPLVVRVDGSDALPVAGVPVTFAVVTGGGAVDSATVTTTSSGLATMGVTLGATVGTQTFSATAPGLTAVSFGATATAAQAPGTWTGAVDTSWNTAGNWAGGSVPTTTTDVVIPAGTPRAPTVTVLANAHDLLVQAGATLTINLSGVNVSGSLDAPGSIVGTTTSVNLTGTGTVRGNLTGTFFSTLVNGSYTLNGRLVTPGLTINGQLTLGGFTASVGSSVGDDFQTSNNGVLVMTNPLDSLLVGGAGPSVIFDGGSTAGRLTSGVIVLSSTGVAGFSQDNTFNDTSYAPTGTHKVVLNTTGSAILDFATPGTGSQFNILDLSTQTGGIILSTPIRVNGLLRSTPAGAPAAINGGSNTLTAAGGTQVTGLTLTNAPVAISGGSTLQFDGVTFQSMLGTATQLTVDLPGAAAPLVFNNLVFSTVPTSGLYLSATDTDGPTPNVLTVNLVNPTPATPGGFTLAANGAVINWPPASPARTWTGSVSTDWNVAGNWSPAGVPVATDDVIVPSGPSNMPLVTGTFTINSLAVSAGATLDLNGNVLTVTGNVFADGAVNAPGQVNMTGTAQVRGTLPTLNVILGGVVTASGPVTATVGLNVSGAGSSFQVGGQTVTVSGNFATSSAGVLSMTNPADHLIVTAQATFNGGNELGLLSAGVLEIGGNLTQANGSSNDSYHTSGTHLTLFTGNTIALQFASPGNVPGSSHFEQFRWTGTGTLTLNSDVYAHGTFDGSPGISGTIASPNHLLQVGNLIGGGTTLSNTRLVIDGTAGGPIALDNVTFTGMASTATQLTVLHPGTGGPFTFNNLSFSGVPTTGFYLSATDTDGSANGFLTLDLVNPAPATPGSFSQVTNGAVINWPAGSPVKTWTGAATSDWQTTTNWSPAGLPTATDDVVIPATANQPVMSAAVTIHSLTVQTGVLVNLNSFALNVNGDLLAPSATSFAGGGGTLNLLGTARTLGGTLGSALPVNISGTYQLSGRTVVGNLTLSGTGDLAANGHTLVVSAALNTINSGTLTMTNPLDSVLVTGAGIFGGGFTGGKLTAGYLKIGGSFSQTSGTTPGSFAASGTHTTELGAAAVRVVTFANPGFGTGTSQFNNLIVTGATGGLTLNSNLALLGTLISLPSATTPTMTATGGRTITVRGSTQVVGLFLDGPPVILDFGGGGSFQFDDAIFQNMPTGVNQLTILHPGTPSPIVLTDLVFNNVPAAGAFYISATDADGASPDALVLDLVAPSPGTSGGFSQALNGAVINWPAGAGSVIWTGATSTDWFTASNWSGGVVPTGASDVVIPAATPNAPSLNSSTGINSLTVQSGAVLTTNDISLDIAGNVDASGLVTGCCGDFIGLTTGTLRGNFDNVVLNVAGGGVVTLNGGTFLTNSSVQLGGEMILAGNPLSTPQLLVQNGGLLTMTNPSDIVVASSVNFTGGDETGHLTDGVISTQDFTQGSSGTGGGLSFVASGAHQVLMGGPSSSQITFASPAQSHFQNLNLSSVSATVTLNSDVNVTGLLASTPSATPPVVTTAVGARLTAGDFVTTGLTFNAVPLVLTNLASTFVQKVTFQSMDPTITQLTASGTGSGSAFVFDTLDFQTTPTSGLYIQLNDLDGPTPNALTVDVLNSTPAAGAPFIQANNGAVLNWAPAAPFNWTGTVSSDWFTGANWSGGNVPGSTDSPVILAAAPNQPVLSTDATVANLTIQPGAAVDIGINNLVINGSLDDGGSINGTGRGTVVLAGPGQFARGGINATVTVSGNYSLNGRLTVNGSLSANGPTAALVLNGNTAAVGNFTAGVGALLVMVNGTDSLIVTGDVIMDGGDLTGLLTAGTVTIDGNFVQSATSTPKSFNPTGTHKVVFGPATSHTVFFASPLPTDSRFQLLTISTTGPVSLLSDATVVFDLDITAGALDINGHTLTVGGAFRTSGTGTFIQQQVADSIAVQGAAVFGGGSTSGNLTNGFLRIGGSLTQTAGTSSTSFAPSGSHTTSLGAVAARAVNFATPGTGAGGSHFANLLATLATGGLTLGSDVFIDGQLITQVGGPTPLLTGGGKTVTAKQFAVQGLKVDNAPMILNEGTTILAQQFDGVTFQNFPTAGVTQLTLNVAGASLTVRPITFNNTTFTHLATVGVGAFYVKSTSSNGLGSVLTLSGASESPQIGGNGPSFTQATAPASVNWP